jgi:hypothetical protein
MNIIKPSAFMRSEPNDTSPLETECLFGETVEILEQSSGWVYCKLTTDNYTGWIKNDVLGQFKNPTHRVIVERSFIYKAKDPKSNFLVYLPMGSQLEIEKIEIDWVELSIINNKQKQIGYVPTKHIVDLNHRIKDWVRIAEELVGTPYRWGGRDTIGIDCSALLQLSYQTYGEVIPRNTSQQIKLKKKIVTNICNLKRGCVIFWEGHVGIMTDRINCVHANAFHMKVKIEPLNQIIKRTEKNNNIKKMMDFN